MGKNGEKVLHERGLGYEKGPMVWTAVCEVYEDESCCKDEFGGRVEGPVGVSGGRGEGCSLVSTRPVGRCRVISLGL
jgi:hypothetical protein